jgi:gamma-butyrobetaine dioxygenase
MSDDLCHEGVGAEWLKAHFPVSVFAPVRLHVAAKRYLCAIEPEYVRHLSEASLHSFHLQGGAISHEEVAAFACEPFHGDAIALRRWDDEAKDPSVSVPPLERYQGLLRSLVLRE